MVNGTAATRRGSVRALIGVNVGLGEVSQHRSAKFHTSHSRDRTEPRRVAAVPFFVALFLAILVLDLLAHEQRHVPFDGAQGKQAVIRRRRPSTPYQDIL